jgi:hypothetical protein
MDEYLNYFEYGCGYLMTFRLSIDGGGGGGGFNSGYGDGDSNRPGNGYGDGNASIFGTGFSGSLEDSIRVLTNG